MADKPAPPAAPPAPSPEEPPSWFGPAIDKLLGKLFDAGKADVVETPKAPAGDPAKPPPVDVEGQMRKAAEDVLSAREKQSAEDAEKTALKAEVERLKGLVEKQPKEFRRLTRLMWGDDDE